MSEHPTAAQLRRFDLFDDLADGELGPWTEAAVVRQLAPGDMLAEPSAPSSGLHLLLAGTARTFAVDGERTEPVGRQIAPTWLGAIAALTEGTLGVRVVAETPMTIATIEPETFRGLALTHPAVHRRVMRQVGPVIGRLTALEHNRERLASLGTMAAGLAHEMNNPAAAARRAAADVAEALDVIAGAVGRFVEHGTSSTDACRLVGLQRDAMARADRAGVLDALDAADAEDALRDRLEDLGVAEAWRLAPPLAAAGINAAWLDELARLAGPATADAIAWIAASLDARRVTAELRESVDRIGSLVGAVKAYAYMDRGEVVEADVHEGLEATVTILGHKLKHTRIQVARAYDRTLPPLLVHGAELNQVWTNLIDNAIDALGESGTITLRTRRDGACAVVEIGDDGPGIPEDVRDRVFDPFFTTKSVGDGTGLGLDVALRIVRDRHDGSIAVESRPGETTFSVRLPLPS